MNFDHLVSQKSFGSFKFLRSKSLVSTSMVTTFIVSPLLVIAASFFGSSALAQTVPSGIVLEGNISNSQGVPEEAASVSFTVQVRSPGLENCLLYQESQILNMSNSGGMFSFNVGQGVRPSSGFESTSSLRQIFNNNAVALTGLSCQSGSSYTPAATDKRKVFISFNDGSGWQSVSQSLDVQAVPYALFADSLQGKLPGDFINVNSSGAALTQSNLEAVFNNAAGVTQLEALIAGTSSQYAKSSSGAGIAIPGYAGTPSTPAQGSIWFNTSTNRLSFYDGSAVQTVGTSGGSVTSITAGSGLSGGTITSSGTISMPSVGSAGTYTKVTTDAQGRVSGGASLLSSDIPSLDAGKITTGTFAAALIPSNTDSTKLPLAGGTMTGAIAMGTHDITNTGYLTIAGNHYLGLGAYTSGQETALIGTLTAAYAGIAWYNSSLNQIKYWDGSSAKVLATGDTAISSLNGLTSATQTFANGTSGTTPSFSSSGSTHTLNIPSASASGVTAGLLSNSDYNQIIRKDGTAAFTADQSFASHKATNLANPVSAQDAATKNYADTHIGANATDPSLSTLVNGSAGAGSLLTWDQTNNRWTAAMPATSGTVTSVGLSLPSIFTVANSPVTSTGTLTAKFASQTANTVFAGPTSGSSAPAFRQLNLGDLRSSISGPLFVAPNCTSAQTLSWSSLTDNFNCQSISSLSWSAISSGLPTTLGGYGIIDAVTNAGGTPSIQSGNDASKPAPSVASTGAIYVAGDTKTIYQYNGSTWVAIATSTGSGGTITALTGDVSASGTGSVSSTVNKVGNSTAANVHAAELLANAATDANTASTIIKRDALGAFSAGQASLTQANVGKVVYNDSGSNTVTIRAPTSVGTSYTLKWPLNLGSADQVLTTDASGNLSWSTPNAGTVTSIGVTGPITNTGTATDPVIGITMSGDATISAGGVVTLKNTGTAGTYTKVTTDAQGRVTSATNIAASDVTTALGFTPLNRAGDTMSGPLLMGGNGISGVNGIGMSAQSTLLLGSYTTAQESAMGLTNTAADIGKTWYNSNTNQLKYWNGTTATALAASGSGLQSLNGLTTGTQTFAVGTSGTGPAFSSSTSTHTLNIPFASTSGVTAGLLSNSDYASFVKSDGSVAFTANQSMGSHKLTSVTDPTSAQDAATKNYSDSNVAGKAVATSVATAVTGSVGNGFVLTWDQTAANWKAVAPATSGTVTSVTAGSGLSGGTITSSGTIALASIANNSLLANTSGSSAAPTATTLSALIDSSIGSTQGNILYRDTNANGWKVLSPGTSGQVLTSGGAAANPSWASAAATGVTSVGLTLPSIFTVTNSPVTSTGTLTGALANQSANLVFAGPSSGGAAAPTFRSIASADLPTITVAKGGTGATSLTPSGILMADITGSSVSSSLCASGQALVSSGTAYACTTVATSSTAFVNGGNSFGAAASIGTADNYNLNFNTNNTTKMTILAGGNVGIGNTSPSAMLSIGNGQYNVGDPSLSSEGLLSIHSSNQYLTIGAQASSPYAQWIQSRAGVALPLLLNPMGGNVGIGTTSPNGALHVKSDTSSAKSRLVLQASTGNTSTSGTDVAWQSDNGTDIAMISGVNFYNSVSYLAFSTYRSGLNERMRIDEKGNVGIGTTSPAAMLDVSGEIKPGNSGLVCSNSSAGALRYNAGSIEFCNGGSWTAIAGSSTVPSGTLCGMRTAQYNSSWSFDNSSANVSCQGNTLSISGTPSNPSPSGCPTGYTTRAAYTGYSNPIYFFFIYCSKN